VSLQLDAKPGCTLVLGESGSGKTSFALKYLVARADFTCRFLFCEPKRDFRERLLISDCETEADCEMAVEDGFVVYYPGTMFPGDWKAGLEWFSEWSYRIASGLPGRKVLMVDEAWKHITPYALPRGVALWTQDGRSFGCETIFCATRPNKLNEALINEATEAVSFRLQGDNALQTVRKELGLDSDEVANLPLGSFVAVNCETGSELRGRLW